MTISLLVLSAAALLLTRKKGHWASIVAALVFGFALASSSAAPTVEGVLGGVTHAVSAGVSSVH